jgi:hypothetical protein
LIAGAGAAYLNGGLLGWEFAFCTLLKIKKVKSGN